MTDADADDDAMKYLVGASEIEGIVVLPLVVLTGQGPASGARARVPLHATALFL
eukprot:gene26854-4457_t